MVLLLIVVQNLSEDSTVFLYQVCIDDEILLVVQHVTHVVADVVVVVVVVVKIVPPPAVVDLHTKREMKQDCLRIKRECSKEGLANQ